MDVDEMLKQGVPFTQSEYDSIKQEYVDARDKFDPVFYVIGFALFMILFYSL